VVLSSDALLPFASVWRSSALALAELGIAAFLMAGAAVPALGGSAPWFVLAAILLAAMARAVDIESWGLLIPGGLWSAPKIWPTSSQRSSSACCGSADDSAAIRRAALQPGISGWASGSSH
jgi:hypothetical protein